MTGPAELGIWMGDRRVGMLDGAERRNLRVVYDDDWRADPSSTPLSVSMPLAAKVHSGQRVAAYLWGLLPDNDRVVARWAAAAQCSPADVFGVLRSVGDDVAGAARYLPTDADYGEIADPTEGFEPLDDLRVAELVRTVRADATACTPAQEASRSDCTRAQADSIT